MGIVPRRLTSIKGTEREAKAKLRAFDAIVITKLDRLARSTRHLTQLAGELEALGVDLVVIDQGIDTSTPTGKLLFNVLAAIAEFERDLILERVQAGVQAARKRGTQFGRPQVLGGQQQARARRLRGSGKSVRAIAKLLGVSRPVVVRAVALKSPEPDAN